MTARIEHAETAGGTRTPRSATLTGTRRTYDRVSSAHYAMREARARESRAEGETRR